MFENKINKIYARTNESGLVTKIFSEIFEKPLTTDILINNTNTDRHGANKYPVVDENGYYNYCIINGQMYERDKTQDIQNTQLNELRKRRKTECFDIVDRSYIWYSTLTAEQVSELSQWYQQWLDISKTRTIPVRPTWLK